MSEKCECGKYTVADWDCCNDCLVAQMNKETDALKKIADIDYCEKSGCCQDTSAKACRKCLANVARKALDLDICTDERMCNNCYSGQGGCLNGTP